MSIARCGPKRRLAEREVPLEFVTAIGRRIPEEFVGAIGAFETPYTMTGLQNALTYISEKVAGGQAANPPPGVILAKGRRVQNDAS